MDYQFWDLEIGILDFLPSFLKFVPVWFRIPPTPSAYQN